LVGSVRWWSISDQKAQRAQRLAATPASRKMRQRNTAKIEKKAAQAAFFA
jgi:hypothetical protein